jgi:enamine deaminase RidA (YjgF/YER057c/UK114 family)
MAEFPFFLGGLGYNPNPITNKATDNNGAHLSGCYQGNESFPDNRFSAISSSTMNDAPVPMMTQHQQQQHSQGHATAAYQAYYYYYYYQQLQQQQQQQQQQQFYSNSNHGHINIGSTTTAASYPQSLNNNTTADVFPDEGNNNSISYSEEVANQIASSIVQKIMGNQQDNLNCNKDMSLQQHPKVDSSASTTFVKALQPDESPPPSHWKGAHSNRWSTLEDNASSTTNYITRAQQTSSVLSKIMISSDDPTPPTITTNQYREARQQYFQTIEYPRKQMAMIKNLEYVHSQEELRLKAQLEQLKSSSSTTAASNRTSSNYAFTHQIDKKKQALLLSKAGIGTRQRNVAVKTFGGQQQQLHHKPDITGISSDTSSTTQQGTNSNNSIYVSGLVPPISKEDTIRQLFDSYSISDTKPLITFYKNSQTGLWKGDALIVYEGDNVPNINDICSQVSCSEYVYA